VEGKLYLFVGIDRTRRHGSPTHSHASPTTRSIASMISYPGKLLHRGSQTGRLPSVYNHFNQDRSLTSRSTFKLNRAAALTEWRGLCAE